MGLDGVNQVLTGLKGRYISAEQRQFQKIQLYWEEVVGPNVANHARPVGLFRGVLKVATMSSAWAQNLVFERQRILAKLNQKLGEQSPLREQPPLTEQPTQGQPPEPQFLKDIRFSTAQWHSDVVQPTLAEVYQTQLWQQHPSRLDLPAAQPETQRVPQPGPRAEPPPPKTPDSAFQQWAGHLRTQAKHLPLCPVCDCPTPQGELDRWNVCGLCAVKQWK
jgi:predicted nucleic acid-binding Zn ribbon protein